jgi:hypothetical protein
MVRTICIEARACQITTSLQAAYLAEVMLTVYIFLNQEMFNIAVTFLNYFEADSLLNQENA